MRTTISAIQVMPSNNAIARSGVFTQLPSDAPLEICGAGWSPTTVLVRYEGVSYVVFRQDLSSTDRSGTTLDGERRRSSHPLRRAQYRPDAPTANLEN